MKHSNTGAEVTTSQTSDGDSLVDVIKPRNSGKHQNLSSQKLRYQDAILWLLRKITNMAYLITFFEKCNSKWAGTYYFSIYTYSNFKV